MAALNEQQGIVITSPYASINEIDSSFEDGIISEKYVQTLTVNALDFVPLVSSGTSTDIVATINASTEGLRITSGLINIDGSVSFSAGYDPTSKVAAVAGNYASALSGASVKIFPSSSIGIVAYASDGSTEVFRVDVGGTNVGDVKIGNYSGNNGILWDNSASTFKIRGDMDAGSISGTTITASTYTTGASGTTRLNIASNDDAVVWYGSDNNERMRMKTDSSTSPKRGMIYTSNSYQLYLDSASGNIDCGGNGLINVVGVNTTGNIDMNTKSITEIDALNFVARSSTPSNAGDWGQWAHSSGGTYQMRVRLNGANYSQNLSPA